MASSRFSRYLYSGIILAGAIVAITIADSEEKKRCQNLEPNYRLVPGLCGKLFVYFSFFFLICVQKCLLEIFETVHIKAKWIFEQCVWHVILDDITLLVEETIFDLYISQFLCNCSFEVNQMLLKTGCGAI